MDFSLNLPAPSTKLMDFLIDYENMTRFIPMQLKSVKIIEKNMDTVITEEVLEFKTIIKNKIIQQCIHKRPSPNELITEITSGPAKNTIITIKCKDVENGTEVHIDIDLKLSLKAKIFQPLIKKVYKQALTATLYRMNTVAMED
jgi:hypothetical protein